MQIAAPRMIQVQTYDNFDKGTYKYLLRIKSLKNMILSSFIEVPVTIIVLTQLAVWKELGE